MHTKTLFALLITISLLISAGIAVRGGDTPHRLENSGPIGVGVREDDNSSWAQPLGEQTSPPGESPEPYSGEAWPGTMQLLYFTIILASFFLFLASKYEGALRGNGAYYQKG
ncbi:MAG: hypothetical protein KAT70_03600 [Thermoplasmata archaeon]|nr:hypothetical protein [Thermoplasmata archaeon]